MPRPLLFLFDFFPPTIKKKKSGLGTKLITVLVFSSKESVVVLVDSLLRIKNQCVGYIRLARKAFKHASSTLLNITYGFCGEFCYSSVATCSTQYYGELDCFIFQAVSSLLICTNVRRCLMIAMVVDDLKKNNRM